MFPEVKQSTRPDLLVRIIKYLFRLNGLNRTLSNSKLHNIKQKHSNETKTFCNENANKKMKHLTS